MLAYTFDFLNRDGSIDTFDIGAFDSDAEALVQARAALLSSLTAVAVEVWREGEAVAIVRRPGSPPSAANVRGRGQRELRAR